MNTGTSELPDIFTIGKGLDKQAVKWENAARLAREGISIRGSMRDGRKLYRELTSDDPATSIGNSEFHSTGSISIPPYTHTLVGHAIKTTEAYLHSMGNSIWGVKQLRSESKATDFLDKHLSLLTAHLIGFGNEAFRNGDVYTAIGAYKSAECLGEEHYQKKMWNYAKGEKQQIELRAAFTAHRLAKG